MWTSVLGVSGALGGIHGAASDLGIVQAASAPAHQNNSAVGFNKSGMYWSCCIFGRVGELAELRATSYLFVENILILSKARSVSL